MDQRRIGDVQVSAIGLGAMPLSTKDPRPSPEEAAGVVHAALDAGITDFDHADIYAHGKSEEVFGELLAEDPELRRIVSRSSR